MYRVTTLCSDMCWFSLTSLYGMNEPTRVKRQEQEKSLTGDIKTHEEQLLTEPYTGEF